MKQDIIPAEEPKQKEYMIVDADAVTSVVRALNGPAHYIREIQATRGLDGLPGQAPNPLSVLTDQVRMQLKYKDEIGLDAQPTPRGFSRIEFKDRYDIDCSIQISSAATYDAIWFGVNDDAAHPIVQVNGEWVKVELPEDAIIRSRMHLTRQQVASLLPTLLKFVVEGKI